jgi:predicted TIM-barrel fold metal-dependent hydrolase
MRNRREFLRGVAGATAGAFLLHGDRTEAMPPVATGHEWPFNRKPGWWREELWRHRLGRIKTVDVHCHINVPEVTAFLVGTPLQGKNGGGGTYDNPLLVAGGLRLQTMDKEDIDVQVVSINSFWDAADRNLATGLIDLQNQKLVEMLQNAPPGRFAAFGTVALQFPDLAAQQLQSAMNMGLKGALIGGSCNGEEISLPKYDPFWAKAEELQAPIFVHPQNSSVATGISNRVLGPGALGNVCGNPLETTLFLVHMIFNGVFDRFPNLNVLCAHGGGYLPAYPDRMDHGCLVFPEQCTGANLKKRPTEYLRSNVLVDSLVFTPEALRHLVAVMGASRIMLGTDYPFPWVDPAYGSYTVGPVDNVFDTPGLTPHQQVQILSTNACEYLRIRPF